MTKPRPAVAMMIGLATKGYKANTMVLLTRRSRSKWWQVVCFGQKGHYRKDGSCVHTDELISRTNPAIAPHERIRLVPFGEGR